MIPWSFASITALATKIPIIILLVLYALFAFIIVRQIGVMHRTLPTSIGGMLKLIAWIHFGLALILSAVALGIL